MKLISQYRTGTTTPAAAANLIFTHTNAWHVGIFVQKILGKLLYFRALETEHSYEKKGKERNIMKQLLTALILAAVLVAGAWSNTAQAQGYVGMSYVKSTIDIDGLGEADIGALDLRFGRMVNDYVGFEGRIGFGVADEEVSVCYYYCVSGDIGLKHYFGAYMRAHLAPPGGFAPYILLGVTQGTLEASTNGYSDDDSDSDVSFGIGIDAGGKDASFTIEYASLFDKDGVALDGVSIGFVTRF